MVRYGEGLARELVKAVNSGEIKEPLTREKVVEFCKLKDYDCSDNMLNVVLSNSEIDAKHSPTVKKYFKIIDVGKYIVLEEYRDLIFEEQIIKSKKDTHKKRVKRLSEVENTEPDIYISTVVKLKRNPDVVAEVLLRANGKCEKCEKEAPFIKKSDNEPYLEVHHLKRLSDGGEDTIENCIGVCPNCHREFHYGQEKEHD